MFVPTRGLSTQSLIRISCGACGRAVQKTRTLTLCRRRTLHTTSCSRGEGKDSFRGQLLQSTRQRVRREKDEQGKYARETSEGGRTLATTFLILSGTALGWYCGTLWPRKSVATSTTPLSVTQSPKHDLSPINLEAAWADFVDIVGKDNVATDQSIVDAHSGSSWSSYMLKEGEKPFCVVYPSSTEEVSKIIKVCHQRKIPVTPYSGGTSLEGHYAATRGGICIDFGHMNRILELHKDDLDVVVQPAVGWEALNDELEKDGLFFPPDPGPGAMIGGMIGTGCSGTNAYHYGTMREWVISLTVVLADGTVIRTRQRPRKSSAGYDLTKLFIGSEGTLGLVTEATLKLAVKPKSQSIAVASFPTIRHAAQCVSRAVEDGISLAAIEILDDVQMKCINDSGSTTRQWREAPTLFFKFAGTPTGVKEQIELVRKLAKSNDSQSFDFARNTDEMAELWSARKEALWSVMFKRRDENDHVWTTDVAVPISRLPDIIEQTKDDMRQSGLLGSIVGHVGDGNFHTILLWNEKERRVAEEIVHRMVKRAIEMEGTVTGEHGVGLIKRDYLPLELGEPAVDAMRRLKLAFDPLCLLNCDKIVRVEKPKSGESLKL